MQNKVAFTVSLLLLGVSFASASTEVAKVNPIEKILQMIGDLQQKIIKEGEEEHKLFAEFSEWCEDESKEKQFEIKTGEANKESLEATIAKSITDADAADTAIAELGAGIAKNEEDLAKATRIRDAEHADFVAVETDLVDTVDILERATGILEKEMAKHGAALVQQPEAADGSTPTENLVNTLQTILDASSLFTGPQKSKLVSLVQSKAKAGSRVEEAEDNEAMMEAMGAPDPAAYKGSSGGIIDVLKDMTADAEAQLADARKAEMNAQHNYELLKQAITDDMNNQKKDKAAATEAKAAAEETKATAEGDLANVNKDLEEDKAYLDSIHQDCMQKASDFEAAVKSRDAELEALATAKKIIAEATAGATEEVYDASAASFIQVSSESRIKATGERVVDILRKMAERDQSASLAQLVSRVKAVLRAGTAFGDDPFAKVKGLIKEMIERLIKEAEAEASHKAWCDEEMAETKEKKDDLEANIEKYTVKIDKMTADIAMLKEEVKKLQAELAALAKSEAEMDKLREEQHAEFVRVKKELEEGVEGLQMALKVLRDYYAAEGDAHGKASGAGSGIIGLLEVAESDFTKNLSDVISEEDSAQAEYDKIKKENAITRVTKEQDVKYKTKEYKGLEKAVAEAKSDLAGFETEYAAVTEYWEKLEEQCIAKPEPYEEIKRRREAEIAGLKEALSILEAEAFIQVKSVTRHFMASKK